MNRTQINCSKTTTNMWRSARFSYLVTRLSQVNISNVNRCYSQMLSQPSFSETKSESIPSEQKASREIPKHYIGENVSRKDRTKFLLTTLRDMDDTDSKEAIYGALDAWVAWEQNFPIGSLRNILLILEKEQQWHRIVQVIKWMLNKGQGTTMGIYGQLIRALDMDHRVGEAHKFWEMKIGTDLHSVPWQLCHLMISVYYRNNMLEDLVRLFKGLEAFDRKPRDKLIIQKVANAYEMLGLIEEKERVMEKYSHLFTIKEEGLTKKGGRKSSAKKKKGKPGESRKDSADK